MSFNEIWKDVEGYENLYQVSNLGKVRALNYKRSGKTRELKPIKMDVYGHLYVSLTKTDQKKQKLIQVHRLVAKAFLEGFSNDLVVHHIDHNPLNNDYTNLMLMTPSEHSKETWKFNKAHMVDRYRMTAKILKRAERNQKIFEMIDAGMRYAEIAAKFDLSEISIKKLAQKHKSES